MGPTGTTRNQTRGCTSPHPSASKLPLSVLTQLGSGVLTPLGLGVQSRCLGFECFGEEVSLDGFELCLLFLDALELSLVEGVGW